MGLLAVIGPSMNENRRSDASFFARYLSTIESPSASGVYQCFSQAFSLATKSTSFSPRTGSKDLLLWFVISGACAIFMGQRGGSTQVQF